MRLLAIVSVLGLLGACASSTLPAESPPPSAASVDLEPLFTGDVVEVAFFHNPRVSRSSYRIDAGDVLRVDVAEHPTLSRERVIVLPDGRVSLPVIGPIAASGNTVESLAGAISQRLSAENINNPRVVVAVEDADVRILTLIQSVMQNTAAGSTIQFTVPPTGTLDLPFVGTVPLQGSFDEVRSRVQDAYRREFGRQLAVTINARRRLTQTVYVLGEVTKPGAVDVPKGAHPLGAIAAAGGFAITADPTNVIILRPREGGFDRWGVNMEALLNAKDPQVPGVHLRHVDVVFVPKSGIAEANQFVDQYIRKMLPFNLGTGLGLSYPLGNNN